MSAVEDNMTDSMNPLKQLSEYGQSPWLDNVNRADLKKGIIEKMVSEDGLKGVTSNPSIFEKAMGGSDVYDDQLKQLLANGNVSAGDLYEQMAIVDIQEVADKLKPVYEKSGYIDGYVSLEVSPYLANDTDGTLEEARRLWKTVDRKNLMVKVPATKAGIPAIRTLIGEGININVTLLFGQAEYQAVAEAYIAGVETLAKNGGDVKRIASVASFFVSRIDTLIDGQLDEKIKGGGDAAKLGALQGQVAIANARLAYKLYKQLFAAGNWKSLADKGAHPQRLLWASTSMKNKKYSDVRYVEELIGPETVDTIPPATMDAFRDHGKARHSLEDDLPGAQKIMDDLKASGIVMQQAVDKLVEQGVGLFADAFDQLLGAVEKKRVAFLGDKLNSMEATLPADLDAAVKENTQAWLKAGKMRRIWKMDKSVWTGADEDKWLGWLNIVDQQRARIGELMALRERAKRDGFTHVLLLGMGGSSLGPEVLEKTFGRQQGWPELLVLDSTDPQQIKTFESKIDLAKTLFIVSSKSGSTLEPNIFKQYFFERAKSVLGDKASDHFIAVTDPGSNMQKVAEGDKFSGIYYGLKTIGGRYSVLSDFGMAPGAAMGLDVDKFLSSTAEMVRACSPTVPATENPGFQLGVILGTAGVMGRDKVTIIASPKLYDFGAWAEQLIAESTGKIGKGLIPVDLEPLGDPSVYGTDRIFVYLYVDGEIEEGRKKLGNVLENARKQNIHVYPDSNLGQAAGIKTAVDKLVEAGHPVVKIKVPDAMQLGQEFFRWEMAIAVAGSIIGINPFDQPDVEASKIKTKELTTQYEQTGSLPSEEPFFEGEGVKLFADEQNVKAFKAAGEEKTLKGYLRAWIGCAHDNDYYALLAYIERDRHTLNQVLYMRRHLLEDNHLATVAGFGPRFLHSTGQAYKGGKNSGVFLQITADDVEDIQVPGQKYTFGIVKAAQARGDFGVLSERHRRALRVHFTSDIETGFKTLSNALRGLMRSGFQLLKKENGKLVLRASKEEIEQIISISKSVGSDRSLKSYGVTDEIISELHKKLRTILSAVTPGSAYDITQGLISGAKLLGQNGNELVFEAALEEIQQIGRVIRCIQDRKSFEDAKADADELLKFSKSLELMIESTSSVAKGVN